MVQAIAFDLDGVLVNAGPIHFKALNRALALWGFRISEQEHETFFNGLPTAEKLRVLSQSLGLPKRLHDVIGRLKQVFTKEEMASAIQFDPSLVEILRWSREQGLRLALATNSRQETVDWVLERLQIRSFFDLVLSHESVSAPKPSPEIYRETWARLGVAPSAGLVIEDSAHGLEAAVLSGARVYCLKSPGDLNLDLIRTLVATPPEPGKAVAMSGGMSPPGQVMARPVSGGKYPLEILVPMAGEGRRFREAGYTESKPLIPILGRPMIAHVIENLRPKERPYRFTFLCRAEDLEGMELRSLLIEMEPNAQIVPVFQTTGGAACTTLLAADVLNPHSSLLIANCDQWIDHPIDAFLEQSLAPDVDGGILVFPNKDPKWSYARLDPKGKVREVAEKRCIAPWATVGLYAFGTVKDYIDAAIKMIDADDKTRGEFYVCPVFNYLIRDGKQIVAPALDASQMVGFGTPEDLARIVQSYAKTGTSLRDSVRELQKEARVVPSPAFDAVHERSEA